MADTSAVDAWESLFRAQVAVMRKLAAEFPRDLTLNEYDVLFNLSRHPERRARMRELNSLVLLSQPSISRMVDRLAARGLLEKLPDETDKRGTVVHLTDAGYRLFLSVAADHMRSIAATLGAALSAEELHALGDLSEKLRHAVSGS